MFDLLRARWRQGRQTAAYPRGPVELPALFRGMPAIDPARCAAGCTSCADACPTGAIALEPLRVDLGKCLFCPVCMEECPTGALHFGRDHRLAGRTREGLVTPGGPRDPVRALDEHSRRLFGRSLKLRQVSAGGCSGCEAELVALGNVVFDLGRFGIQFVASPRHADGLVITGPVTHNMKSALLEAYRATPSPRLVVALGACAVSGGPFAGSAEQNDGVPPELPVDLYVPGCPPHPLTIVEGLLGILGRL
jgi:Ni,Fe-hydrogenase III small subunit/NAD-dependent dihydropyrimidine dehydrogenase PreA subunit